MRESLSEQAREALEEVQKSIGLIIKGNRSMDQLVAFNNGLNPFAPEFITPEMVAKRELKKQLALASKIFDKDFLGPQAVTKAFGINVSLEQIPAIPFSHQELNKAKELNQFLVLRPDELADGVPATMLNLYKLCQPKFTAMRSGKVLRGDIGDYWCREHEFFIKDTPRLVANSPKRFKWALVTKGVIKDSLNWSNHYLDQILVLIDYLSNKVFAGQTMPLEYQEAIVEFKAQRNEISELMAKDKWDTAFKKLSELQINQICRRSPVEAFYDFLIYFLNNKKRLLRNQYDWTFRLDDNGYLVYFGHTYAAGSRICVYDRNPDSFHYDLGVCFSRS